MEIWVQIIVPIVTGLAACVPLVITIINMTKKNTKSQNWMAVMQLVLTLMVQAEASYETGAERKEFVLNSIKEMQDTLNYEVDLDAIGAMIDAITKASQKINTDK